MAANKSGTESDIVVDVRNVSMEFNMSNLKVDSLKEYVVRMLRHELFFNSFYALSDVSFKVHRGEVLGLVGFNGSGKSTLLKIISGIIKPTRGSVEVHGTLSPMIELGAGFDPDLSARENIFLNGSILGYSKQFMESVFDDIVDFAELGDFLDTPVKNFSSGMQARLGFAVATVVRPQLLIVDEVLAVGDYKFQEKCSKRISEMMADDTTVIMVSHSADQIERMCTRAIWLDHGRMIADGDARDICRQYRAE